MRQGKIKTGDVRKLHIAFKMGPSKMHAEFKIGLTRYIL